MTKFIIGAVVGALVTFLIANANAADLDAQFNEIAIGAQAEQVLAQLGKPDAEVTWDTLSLQQKRWKWTVGTRAYVVVFMFDRVISKKACTGAAVDC